MKYIIFLVGVNINWFLKERESKYWLNEVVSWKTNCNGSTLLVASIQYYHWYLYILFWYIFGICKTFVIIIRKCGLSYIKQLIIYSFVFHWNHGYNTVIVCSRLPVHYIHVKKTKPTKWEGIYTPHISSLTIFIIVTQWIAICN